MNIRSMFSREDNKLMDRLIVSDVSFDDIYWGNYFPGYSHEQISIFRDLRLRSMITRRLRQLESN